MSDFLTLDDKIDKTLLDARRIFFSGGVGMDSANDAIRQLWYLELKDPGKPITFVINSPGGAVSAGFAVWDQAKMISAPITTIVTGLAASMGSVLSLMGDKGRRFATPNSRIMIHQPSMGGIQGAASDLEIQAKEILKTRDRIIDLYVDATGKDRDTIAKAIDRDTWLSANEAVDYGLIDRVVAGFNEID